MSIGVLQGILFPFLGTVLGAACVFAMGGTLHPVLQRALTGFAAGVMVAASIWSLLIPAIEQSKTMGQWAFVPAVVGFWLGILFLLLLDKTIPHLHQNSGQAEGPSTRLKNTTMLVLAVALHNIPEGMAVGAVLAGWRGDGKGAILSLWRLIRYSGTGGRCTDHWGGGIYPAGFALSAQFRSRCYGLCCCRGIDSRDFRRATL